MPAPLFQDLTHHYVLSGIASPSPSFSFPRRVIFNSSFLSLHHPSLLLVFLVRTSSTVSQFQRPCPWAPCSTLFFPSQHTWSLYRTVICVIGSRTYSIISGKSSLNESARTRLRSLTLKTCQQVFWHRYRHGNTHTDTYCTVQAHIRLQPLSTLPYPSLPADSPSLLLALALSLLPPLFLTPFITHMLGMNSSVV